MDKDVRTDEYGDDNEEIADHDVMLMMMVVVVLVSRDADHNDAMGWRSKVKRTLELGECWWSDCFLPVQVVLFIIADLVMSYWLALTFQCSHVVSEVSRLEDISFIFLFWKQYFTHSLCSFVKYCLHHSKTKFISPHHRAIYSMHRTMVGSSKAGLNVWRKHKHKYKHTVISHMWTGTTQAQ